MKTFTDRIADALVTDGVLTQNQLDEVLQDQDTTSGQLLKILQDRGLVSEPDLLSSMGRCLGPPPINLAKLRVSLDLIELIPKEMALANKMAAVARLDQKLFVAMADPLNVLALDDLRRMRPGNEIIPLITSEKAVTDFINNAASSTGGMEEFLRDVDVPDVEVAQEREEEGVSLPVDLDALVEIGRAHV